MAIRGNGGNYYSKIPASWNALVFYGIILTVKRHKWDCYDRVTSYPQSTEIIDINRFFFLRTLVQ